MIYSLSFVSANCAYLHFFPLSPLLKSTDGGFDATGTPSQTIYRWNFATEAFEDAGVTPHPHDVLHNGGAMATSETLVRRCWKHL